MSALAGAVLASCAPQANGRAAPSVQPKPKPVAKPKAKPKAKAKGGPVVRRVKLDLDEGVSAARKHVEQAKKALRKTAVEQKMQERKKMRLVAKAQKLPMDDLYRIVLYKRVNLMNAMMSSDMEGAVQGVLGQLSDEELETVVLNLKEKRDAANASKEVASALPAGEEPGAAPPGVSAAALGNGEDPPPSGGTPSGAELGGEPREALQEDLPEGELDKDEEM